MGCVFQNLFSKFPKAGHPGCCLCFHYDTNKHPHVNRIFSISSCLGYRFRWNCIFLRLLIHLFLDVHKMCADFALPSAMHPCPRGLTRFFFLSYLPPFSSAPSSGFSDSAYGIENPTLPTLSNLGT